MSLKLPGQRPRGWGALSPPLKICVRATDDGSLGSLSLGVRAVSDVARLLAEIRDIFGDDRGPGSMAGDTSVTGWQLSALRSGHAAYLRVPPITVKKTLRFLDSVQADDGANWQYVTDFAKYGTIHPERRRPWRR